MATSVIGTIASTKAAQALVSELVEAGLEKQDIAVLDGNGPEKQIVAQIVERGFGEDDARGYAQAARGGKTLIVAQAPDEKLDQAVAIIERHENAGGRVAREQGETVQQVEEELAVGKREVATGGARVTSSVSERPVEQTVTLREEKVAAERKPADRALSPEEAEAAFQGKTVEVLATREEAEVSKQARVVGEVVVGKKVAEREETVKDTVRRTEVEVEEIGTEAPQKR